MTEEQRGPGNSAVSGSSAATGSAGGPTRPDGTPHRTGAQTTDPPAGAGGTGTGGATAAGRWASRSGRGGPGGTGGAPAGEGTSDGGTQRLERNRQHKVVAGVCGGLGRYFDLDPVLFRVPVAVLSVMGGLGLLFYAFAWLLLPQEGEDENEARRLLAGRVEGGSLAAVLCALAGCGLLLASLDNSRLVTFALMVTAALTAAAYWSQKTRGPAPDFGAEPRPQAPPEPQAPPTPLAPSWWREPTSAEGYLWGPGDADLGFSDGVSEQQSGDDRLREEQGSGEPWRLSLGVGVFLAALVAGAAATSLVWSSQPLGAALVVGLSAALGVFGLGLVVGAFRGRIGGGTIVAVLATTVLLTGAAALPQDLTTTYSDRVWRPASVEELRSDYQIGSGRGNLDLSGLELQEGQTVRSSLRVAVGEAEVVVPPDARVKVDLRVGAGGYQLPGAESGTGSGGVNGGGFRVTESHTVGPADSGDAKGTIELKLDVSMGAVKVVRDSGNAGGGLG